MTRVDQCELAGLSLRIVTLQTSTQDSGSALMSIATLESSIASPPTTDRNTKRLLLVAYNFPPVGGAGVQRPVKWAKYLGRLGWDVTVLTTLNPSVPVRDESLLAEVPADVAIVRARTWEPDYRVKQNLISASPDKRLGLVQQAISALRGVTRRCVKLALQPDPQVLWNYHAIRAGAKVLRERRHDAILVTAPAYSSFFIGAALKRKFGLPLILDYRDEWDLSGKYLENAQRDWISRIVQTRMQSRLLKSADAVVATTELSTAALAEKLSALRHHIPAHCIYNGFDADEFDSSKGSVSFADTTVIDPPDAGTFRLVYTGTLWNLTDITPLVRGIEQLNATYPDLAARLEVVCVGRKTPEQLEALARLNATPTRLRLVDYCDHSAALQWMRSANGLCLLLSDVPGANRVVPAKLFEYLAVRKDMLAICPPGETADIVRRFFPRGHAAPGDLPVITRWLETRIRNADVPSTAANTDSCGLDEFSRENQTRRLVELLNSLVAKG